MIQETERLKFRRWVEGDAKTLFGYAKDPAVGPIAGWPPHKTPEESREIIEKILSGPECYAICLKENGMPIGTIELKSDTDMTHSDKERELGYWLGKPFWGQGIMTEAAHEIIRHGFEDLGLEKIWCGYYDGNARSARVQEKCGFRYQWTTRDLDVPAMGEKRTGHCNLLTRKKWEEEIHLEKKHQLFEKQKEMLDTFLSTGAISKKQHDESLYGMAEKMGYASEVHPDTPDTLHDAK